MNKDFVSQISYIFLLFRSSRYFTMEDFDQMIAINVREEVLCMP
jgi:hypothetical protein